MPLSNDQMKANRYLRWHQARQQHARITRHLARGGKIAVCTYTRTTVYDDRHAEMFSATKAGVYVRRGKGWDCIDYCAIRFL